ncbi:amylo-alpha-1,6-glucosidase [Mucilaginibacter xinganensis]|uniref:Amylo-alpha-1,6-glucosidase n=1 Tax=Mucilaginibacter xinganensis TaxID=1234841 RepID=A0A223NYN5_9SPHI|nr:amylo-alpha-1,6-glucosidase [Mucilaginibacter xinganensis]ASU34973.1 amylo-alpha-1,6-glucosidase [Mucilaginibacter xinganensis]
MKALPLFILLLMVIGKANAQSADSYAAHIMQGISDPKINKTNPYVTAGDRSYLIGTQDGKFPDLGDHVEGEMAGLWCPPFKLADGFWVSVTDKSTGKAVWLNADQFITYPYGNKFIYKSPVDGVTVERFQFCPDGKTAVLVKYTIKYSGSASKNIKLSFNLKTDIRPVWFTDTVDVDFPDKILSTAKDGYFLARDSTKPWYLAMVSSVKAGNQHSGSGADIPYQTIGKGVWYTADYNLTLAKNSTSSIIFSIAGAENNQNAAISNSRNILNSYDELLKAKINKYKEVIARAQITIPDAQLQNVYNWVKINTSWLVRTVPGTGTGLTAGYMEYPWWFGCDNTYALQGVLATGDFKLAKSTLELLYNKSKAVNGNGRIVHEISTSGKVYNKGNTQETAHFIMCAGTYLKWTGDTAFIKKIYPYIKDGINWLLTTTDTNHNMFPEGYGIMEVTGLNAELIDVAVYTQQALKNAAEMATIMGDKKAGEKYAALAASLQLKVNKSFWDEESTSYCDFFGTKQQALSTLDGALKQLKIGETGAPDKQQTERENFYIALQKKISLMRDTSRGWLTNKNWVINTPMETGIAPYKTAIMALDKIRMENCGEYGPYLSAVEKKYMMTIATGVQAVAECRYGRVDSAMWYVNKIAATFNRVLPGSISEMMPDYGCFTQAWTNYGIDVPLVSYVFGVTPDAVKHTVNIRPNLPSTWKNVNIKNVKVGDNNLSIDIKTKGNRRTYTITQSNAAWKLLFKAPSGSGDCTLNGHKVKLTDNGLTLSANTNTITILL